MPTFTLTQLEQRVLDRVEQNSVFWPLHVIDSSINKALRLVNNASGFYQGTVPVPESAPGKGSTVQNQVIYSTPPPMLVPMRLTFNGAPLHKDTLESLLAGRANLFAQKNAGPPMFWCPIGLAYFLITPPDPQGGGYLEMSGVLEPPLLVNGGDVVVIDDDFVELVVISAFLRLAFIAGGKTFADAYASNFKPWQAKLRSLSMWVEKVQPVVRAKKQVDYEYAGEPMR